VLQELRDRRVAVLAGGQSGEREVSFRSGQGVMDALVDAGIDAVTLDPEPDLAGQIARADADVAFNALHGGAGENGTVQGVLEMAGIPYTGCGILASALTMDKPLTQAVLGHNGFPVPDHAVLSARSSAPDLEAAVARIGLPLVAKPAAEGSSLGVEICKDEEQALAAARELIRQYGRIIVEEFIAGTELAVGVLGWHERTRALPVLEIVPHKEFYDYEAKYTKGMTDLICPARISEQATAEARRLALEVHLLTGCHGISRCDMHLDEQGQLWLHDINSMPGLTETSDVPHEATADGMTYQDLVLEILASAFHR